MGSNAHEVLFAKHLALQVKISLVGGRGFRRFGGAGVDIRHVSSANRLIDLESSVDASHCRVWGLQGKSKSLSSIVDKLYVAKICESCLGQDYRLSSLSLHCLMPGADRIFWHYDYPHIDTKAKPGAPVSNSKAIEIPGYGGWSPMGIQFAWALSSVTEENGATAFSTPSGVARVSMEVGECAVWRADLKHSAMPNVSSARRTVMLASFVRGYIPAMETGISWPMVEGEK